VLSIRKLTWPLGHSIWFTPPGHWRHIKPEDVYELAEMLTVEFNIERQAFQSPFMEMVLGIKPNSVYLSADTDTFTSDHRSSYFDLII